ncbi:MAG: hypothetical protein J6U54_03525 [Clostridiales bacterium]|nr:hypothetical protein [Clostridiales bacterium]
MKYKHVYASHEARMWVMTIISGVSAVASLLAAHPELTQKIKNLRKPKIKIIVVKDGEEYESK